MQFTHSLIRSQLCRESLLPGSSAAEMAYLLKTVAVSLVATQPFNLLSTADANKGPQHYNGMFYEFVDTKRTWPDALADAQSRSYEGHQGTLVNMANYGIMSFVRQLRKLQGLPSPSSFPTYVWNGSV